jgi:hypothetical protein
MAQVDVTDRRELLDLVQHDLATARADLKRELANVEALYAIERPDRGTRFLISANARYLTKRLDRLEARASAIASRLS